MSYLRKPEIKPELSSAIATRARRGLVESRMAGLPFLALSLAPALAFNAPTALIAFLFTALAAFCVHIPVVAGILGVAGEDRADEPLTPRAFRILLLLWIMTDWSIAALWR